VQDTGDQTSRGGGRDEIGGKQGVREGRTEAVIGFRVSGTILRVQAQMNVASF
jgi:hypothetical protein